MGYMVMPKILPKIQLFIGYVCMLVSQSCLTLSSPVDCSTPGSSVHGILQARILEGRVEVAMTFSRVSSLLRERTQVHRAGGFFTIRTTREALL